MRITWLTALTGSLALIGFPGTAGFFSKDAIIEAVHAATLAGSDLAYWAVLSGVFVTALYTFRMFFMTFHGAERIAPEAKAHLHESPAVVWVPLVLLAIPSLVDWRRRRRTDVCSVDISANQFSCWPDTTYWPICALTSTAGAR